MSYSSVEFIFYFLSVVSIYYALPGTWKNVWLIVTSVLWYASWNFSWAILLLAISNVNYFFIKSLKSKPLVNINTAYSNLLLFNILIFIILKSGDLFGFESPYGSSFYLFIIIAMIVDQWRSDQKSEYRWDQFILLPNFFPFLMGGPIERGKSFFFDLDNKRFNPSDLTDGLLIFSLGFLKKELLVKPLHDILLTALESPRSVWIYIVIGVITTLKAYVEFSSYTDMGRGVARTMGIRLSLSFRAFYYSKDPNDYWQRWNITLGTWIRDYVSFPLMLKYGRKIGQNTMLMISFILVGLWHGFTVNWLAFGLYNGVIIILYDAVSRKFKFPFWGRICAWAIIVGNGLLQLDLHALGSSKLVFPFEKWESTLSGISLYSALLFACLLIVEFIQERKNDNDWFLKIPAPVKLGIVMILTGSFISALDADVFMTRAFEDIPVYFKI